MMRAEHWKLVKDIFAHAAELPSAERAVYLLQACDDDTELRAEVESLLSAMDEPANLPPTAMHPMTTVPLSSAESSGTQIGPYKLLKELGEGGFGSVWLAEQKQPVSRQVALKIIKLGMDTKQVIARFDAEKQALAIMDHPNIARVIDAGSTESGRPYFVMELVNGIAITEYCDQHRYSLRERLELFVSVCSAVQHAHQKGIIHRDLKPSNVLVAQRDGRPVAKVIDFGIAKAMDARLTEKTVFTRDNQMIGTPAYMSPEQAGAGGLDIDTRSDVYSLGVLLYELVTGVTPFDSETLRSAAYQEIQRIICEVEPPKPSTRLSEVEALPSVAAQRQVEPAKLTQSLRGELDWIVMKCLEKDRTRRYESANGLAGDIERYLTDVPVQAGPPSKLYRAKKFVRRNRAAVIVTAAITVTAITASLFYVRGIKLEQKRTEQALADAKLQSQISESVSKFQADMLLSADPSKMLGDKVTVLQATEAAIIELDRGKLADQPLVEQAVRSVIGITLQSLGRYKEAAKVQQRTLELARKTHPALSQQVILAMQNYAEALRICGETDRAEALFRDAIAGFRILVPNGSTDLARTLTNLAALLQTRRDFRAAEPLLLEALEMHRKLLPADSLDIAASLNNYALVLKDQGKFDLAEPLLRASYEMETRLRPAGHPGLATSLTNRASVLSVQKRFAEAEQLERSALEIAMKALPTNHPHITEVMSALAETLHDQKKYAEAENMYRDAIERQRRQPGAFPRSYISNRYNFGLMLREIGRHEETIPFWIEGLEARRRVFPANHPDIQQGISALAVNLCTLKRYAEAERYARELVEFRKQALPMNASEVASAENYVGEIVMLQGDFANAELLLLASGERLLRDSGVSVARRRMAHTRLIKLYTTWEKPELLAKWNRALEEFDQAHPSTKAPASTSRIGG